MKTNDKLKLLSKFGFNGVFDIRMLAVLLQVAVLPEASQKTPTKHHQYGN